MGAMMGQMMMGGDQPQDGGHSRGAKKPRTEEEGVPAVDVNKMMKGLFGK
jgi:hypothetical protein